jgi:hypothetical protein
MQRMQGVYATMAPSWDDNNRIEVKRHTTRLCRCIGACCCCNPECLTGGPTKVLIAAAASHHVSTLHAHTLPPLPIPPCSPQVVRNSAILASQAKQLERALLERIPPQAQFVLIGEASHGTVACACRPAACTLIWAPL